MTNETRTIEDIYASLRRNNEHRQAAITARDFYAIVEDWDNVDIAQRDVKIYDELNDRFLDEYLYARSLEEKEESE